jgi:sigma-E factor negative regulatory protein RseB
MTVKHHLKVRFGLILSALVMATAGPAGAKADDGMMLLGNMSNAANKLDYSGEFVYVKDGKISSMKVAHIGATADSGSQQKLMALDGSMREIIQQDDVVACILPDQGMGLRETRQARPLFKLDVADKLDNIALHYTVRHQGKTRVANRDCELINVTPRDTYRYGYRLCTDSNNQLLLSSELLGQDGKVLESYQFVSVNFDKVEASEISSRTAPKTLNWMDDRPENLNTETIPADEQIKWRVTENAAGFELEHYIKRISPIIQAEVTHLVLGDGLAQISVFVSPLDASATQSETSLSMGSLNSFTRKINEFMITVVGEVPKETVMLISEHTEAY